MVDVHKVTLELELKAQTCNTQSLSLGFMSQAVI